MITGAIFYRLPYIEDRGECDFAPHFLAVTFPLLPLSFDFSMFRVMVGEHTPVPEEVVGGEVEVPQPEAIVTDSSSRGDAGNRP
jgi:hypothetical protein